MDLVPASFKEEFKKFQKQLVLNLSKDIIIGFDSVLVETCPNCFYDHMSESSDAQYNASFVGTKTLFVGTAYEKIVTSTSFRHLCPVCRGKGILSIPNEKTIKAHVIWELKQESPDSPVGTLEQDLVSLKADSKYFDDFCSAKYFIVDGRTLVGRDYPVPRGMGSIDGIVEIVCATADSSEEIV